MTFTPSFISHPVPDSGKARVFCLFEFDLLDFTCKLKYSVFICVSIAFSDYHHFL